MLPVALSGIYAENEAINSRGACVGLGYAMPVVMIRPFSLMPRWQVQVLGSFVLAFSGVAVGGAAYLAWERHEALPETSAAVLPAANDTTTGNVNLTNADLRNGQGLGPATSQVSTYGAGGTSGTGANANTLNAGSIYGEGNGANGNALNGPSTYGSGSNFNGASGTVANGAQNQQVQAQGASAFGGAYGGGVGFGGVGGAVDPQFRSQAQQIAQQQSQVPPQSQTFAPGQTPSQNQTASAAVQQGAQGQQTPAQAQSQTQNQSQTAPAPNPAQGVTQAAPLQQQQGQTQGGSQAGAGGSAGGAPAGGAPAGGAPAGGR